MLDPDAGGGVRRASAACGTSASRRWRGGRRSARRCGAAVERANARLSRVEQIKRFTILPVDWAPAGDELTPTMKLKRRPIAEKYAAEIEALYARPAAAEWPCFQPAGDGVAVRLLIAGSAHRPIGARVDA